MTVTNSIPTLSSMVNCAIATKKQIVIQYFDVNHDMTVRAVEPIKWLNPKKDNTRDDYGFLTYCHLRDNYRHFKVSMIERIAITDYDFEWVNHERVS